MSGFGSSGPFQRGSRLLEQYEVTRLLGTGGHAYVYECRDLFLDELLAIKVIPNPPNRGRELLDRARAEAQLLRRLSHPNVVRMHTAAALGDDMVCLVMEKLEGVSLRHLLVLLQRFSWIEAATVVRQVAVGVAAAHQLNVVHRDIKPDNVFVLPPSNHVKVLDFGIAKFLGHGLQTSNKYRFQGTPLYMSPEHLRGSGVTVRSDVYQLGTVLFELVTGINPNLIDLDNPGFEQVAFVQITRPTPGISRLVAGLPPSLDGLVQKATAKEPEQRFATMDEFVQALDSVTQEYLATVPMEAQRMRVVDESLMRQAQRMAAREEQAIAANSQANTAMLGVHTARDPKPNAPSFADAPLTKTSPPPSSIRAANDESQTEKMASFHPVPQLLADARNQSASPSARASQPSAPPKQPADARNQSASPSARASQPPAPRKSAISLQFALAAIGFGSLFGGLILWLMPRGNEAAAEPSAASVETTAGATIAQDPALGSTAVSSPVPATASVKPSVEMRRAGVRNEEPSNVVSVIVAHPTPTVAAAAQALTAPSGSLAAASGAAPPAPAPSVEPVGVEAATTNESAAAATPELDRTGRGSTDHGRRIMTGEFGHERAIGR